MLLLFNLFAITLISSGNGASFSAIVKMNSLLETEAGMIKIIQKYVRHQEERLSTLKNIVKLYKSEHQKASLNPEDYFSNPLNSYLLLKHLTIDWEKAKSLILKKSHESLIREISGIENGVDFPTNEDLSGTVEALVRLQRTYNLEVPQIVKGFLNGVQYGHRLSAEDCFIIGKKSFEGNHYDQTIMWMQEAWNLPKQIGSSVSEREIGKYLALTFYSEGNVSYAFDWTNKLLRYTPTNVETAIYKMFYKHKMLPELIKKVTENLPAFKEECSSAGCEILEEDKNYEKLCRGEKRTASHIKKHLKCRYVDHNDPFLKLAPFKEEEAFLKPRIVIYHDVIIDKEIETLKKLALDVFQESTIIGGKKLFDIRLSNSGWLEEEVHEVVRTINQRTEHLTNLYNDFSDSLQIANYGLGGFYRPHFDYFHLSDVEQGGATVFPELNVALWPRKGSAAFWHNLKINGDGDPMTLHAGCPVLKGSKWVANKWIHKEGQFMKSCPIASVFA